VWDLADLDRVVRQLADDASTTAALTGRLDDAAERLRALAACDISPTVTLVPAAQPLADWAAITRSWRDHYIGIAAEHRRCDDGRARTPCEWVGRDRLIEVHAELLTSEFARDIRDLLHAMADYLGHRVCATRCPDHAAWAAEVRGWAAVYDGALKLHADGMTPGTVRSFEQLLSHPRYRQGVEETLTAELAAGMAARLGGLAEFFQAESRLLAAAC